MEFSVVKPHRDLEDYKFSRIIGKDLEIELHTLVVKHLPGKAIVKIESEPLKNDELITILKKLIDAIEIPGNESYE